MDLTKWSLEFVKWTQGEQNGVRRLENGAQSREGCEGQEPGVRRPAPIQVRFNSVRCSNILIDIRDPRAAKSASEGTHAKTTEKKYGGIEKNNT